MFNKYDKYDKWIIVHFWNIHISMLTLAKQHLTEFTVKTDVNVTSFLEVYVKKKILFM